MHVVGTAGHVDHGKSTLVEALSGMDPDRFEEEKRRGLTIDLGFAWLELPSGNEIGIIDVPGHERFIRNMLAGAGGSSICLFVVAANEGWRQQSAEHLAILDVLGVSNGVVAVTKSDLVDEDVLQEVVSDVAERLKASTLRGIPIVACSATTGNGLAELTEAIDRVVAAAPPVVDRGTPRLWIDRSFTISGAGTVVTGTLMGGSLSIGESVAVARADVTARIRSIQTHKRSHDVVEPGNRVALNLAGVERSRIERGDAVVKENQWLSTSKLYAQVRVLDPEISGTEHALTERGAHLMYTGTAETPVRIRLVQGHQISAGASAFAELSLRDALPLKRGDHFVLRDAGRVLTFGGGRVLDPLPALPRRDPRLPALLDALSSEDDTHALATLVATEEMVSEDLALLRAGAGPADTGAERLGNWLVSAAKLASLKADLTAAVQEHHRDQPLAAGMPKERARRIVLQETPDAFDPLVAVTTGVVTEGDVIKLSTHRVSLDPEQERRRLATIEALEAGGFSPPPTSELEADPPLLRAMVQSGEVVQIGDFHLTAGRAAEVRKLVRNTIEASGPVTVAAIRDLLGTSRKYAVPLCEWLDQTGATRRRGDVRVLGPHE